MKPLETEDYREPCCPLKAPDAIERIQTGRALAKLDEYFSHNDMAGAERHLRAWRAEADAARDDRGKLTIVNEQIGLYRKIGRDADAQEAIATALTLLQRLELENSITAATTYLNIATAHKAFDRARDALPWYEKAKAIYESTLQPTDERLGGLYNNMALTLTSLGDFAQARTLFERALTVMKTVTHAEPEQAITHCNLADLVLAERGAEAGEADIAAHLETAMHLLDTPDLPHNGNYAYVCEKCAPTFGYYGFFAWEAECLKRAREIYERA